MKCMILNKPKVPLKLESLPIPHPNENQVLIKVRCCGVCRTDLHILDGELPHPKLPLILGHQIVGTIETAGSNVKNFSIGDRVGVPWLGGSCGHCKYCLSGRENLCDNGVYTGYQIDGGFSEYCVVDYRYIFPIPTNFSDLEAAPLLCGGLIGYRAYTMATNAKKIGFYGFGSSAHILTQLAVFEKKEIFAFTRSGDRRTQKFALEIGAVWAGDSDQKPPKELDAAIIFAPVGSLVPQALSNIAKGGSVICAGIHMSDIPSFPYHLIYGEKILRSVTNLTRKDGENFLKIAAQIPIKSEITTYSLENTGQALEDLRKGKFSGSGVIVV